MVKVCRKTATQTSRRRANGTRLVALIRRLRRAVIGESSDTKRFVSGLKPTSVVGVNTTCVAGDGSRFMSAAGVGEKFISVAGDGASSMSAGGGGGNSTSVVGDGVRFTSAAGDKPTSVVGPIVVISSGATGVTTVGGIIDTNVGGNSNTSTSVGGKLVMFMNVGGSYGMYTNAGGS